MSIAYLLGKGSSKPMRYKPNIPLLMVLSIIPDADILIDFLTGSQLHRGPTHSIIVAIIAFIPFFVIYRKKAIPYFLALISHPLIGDFFIGGRLELLWPFSNSQFGLHGLGGPYISIYMPIDGLIEVILFLIAMVLLVKSNDWKVFFTAHKLNLLLIIPLVTVLLPSTIGYPFSKSLFLFSPILAVAHVIFVALFSIAVLKTFHSMYHNKKHRKKPGHLIVSGNKEGFVAKGLL